MAFDFSVIYVALAEIGEGLRFSSVALQWIVSAYAISFAGFLLLGGQLADTFGAGRMFFAAQLLFAVSSSGGALSGSAAALIAARVGQGVAAALLVPATLGLLSSGYPAGPRRDRAVSIWGTTGAVGLALGVAVGGGILALAPWQWIFWSNVPVVLVCLLAAANAVRVPPVGERVPPATVATVSASGAIAAVVLVLTELARARPAVPVIAAALVTAVGAGALFVAGRCRGRPSAPPALLRTRTLRVACAVAGLYMASFGAEFYLVTLYLQVIRGYDALAAGMAFLPLAGAVVVGNALAGRLAGRWSPRRLLSVAFLTGAAGLLILALAVAAHGGWVRGILPGLLLSGLGQGAAFTGTFITGTRDLPPESNGFGSALITTAQYTGGSLGLAVLVLLHGERPTASGFVLAFCCTAVVAATAAPLALSSLAPRNRACTVPVPPARCPAKRNGDHR